MTTKNKQQVGKPTLKLVGRDGNAFAIMGEARRVAKKAGWSEDEIKVVTDEAMSGDYDHLLQTMTKHFQVS